MKIVAIKLFVFLDPSGGQVPPFKAGAHLITFFESSDHRGKNSCRRPIAALDRDGLKRGTVTLYDAARATFNNVTVLFSLLVIGHQFV
jgi:hypothetical protein